MTLSNPARMRLERGELALGITTRLARTAGIARSMAAAGYDWLFLDLEHGVTSLETAGEIAAAALDAGIAPLVRVPKGHYGEATRILDNGALGILMPHVDTAEEAREAVSRLRYAPLGHRSYGGGLIQFGYRAIPVVEAMNRIEAASLMTMLIESPEAVENAEAIAAVPGVDVLMVGANDLSIEMGIPGKLGDARIADAIARVAAACRKHGKWSGLGGVYTEDLLGRYLETGVQMIVAGSDMPMLMEAATERARLCRGIPRGR